MKAQLRNLIFLIVFGFLLLALASIYWTVLAHQDLTNRQDNPRRIRNEQQLQRGSIYDRHGRVLAASIPINEDGLLERVYASPAVVSGTGYYDYRFGASGIEAEFEDVLTGRFQERSTWQRFWDSLLNHQPTGYDLRSTLDLDLQQRLYKALDGRHGAAIAIHIPSGEILAMLSLPSVDPRQLEAKLLEKDPNEAVLLNRVLQGLYQPGSAIQALLLPLLLQNGYDLETPIEQTTNFELDTPYFDETESCAKNISLGDAFRNSCNLPFVTALGTSISGREFDTALWQWGFYRPTPIFRTDAAIPQPTPPFDENPDPNRAALAEAIGQGSLTITPLQMAWYYAAIANEGTAPPLTLVEAFRAPKDENWQDFILPQAGEPLLPNSLANTLREALQRDEQIFWHHGVGYSGNPIRRLQWFNAIVDLNNNNGSIVLVLVLEDTSTPDEAIDIALALLTVIQALEP